jgi:hypothetical protein
LVTDPRKVVAIVVKAVVGEVVVVVTPILIQQYTHIEEFENIYVKVLSPHRKY